MLKEKQNDLVMYSERLQENRTPEVSICRTCATTVPSTVPACPSVVVSVSRTHHRIAWSVDLSKVAERVLAAIGNVQKSILEGRVSIAPKTQSAACAYLILVLFVDARHQGSRRRQDLVHEDENGLLW